MVLATSALLFGLVAATFLVGDARNHFRATIQNQLFSLVSRTADGLDLSIQEKLEAMVRVSKGVTAGMIAEPAEAQKFLSGRHAINTLVDGLFILDAKGIAIADFPVAAGRKGTDYSYREWFHQILSTRSPVISSPILGKILKEPVVVIGVPVLDGDGEAVGVLAGVVRLMRSKNLGAINDMAIGKSGYFYVASKDRRFVAHHDKTRVLTSLPEPGANPSLDRAMQGFEGTVDSVSTRGSHGLFSFKSMRNAPWVVAAVLPAEEAYEAVDHLTRNIYLGTATVILVVIPTVWFFLLRLLAPLNILLAQMRTLGQASDLSLIVPCQVASRDEIGELATGFNHMLAEIQSREGRLQQSEIELREITSSLNYGLYTVDEQGAILFFNPAAERMLKWTEAEVLGRHSHELFHHHFQDGTVYPVEQCRIAQAILDARPYTTDQECFFDRDGNPIPVEISVSPIFRNHQAALVVVSFQDISEKKRASEKIQHLALHDQLTGLPNRHLLNDRIVQMMQHVDRRQKKAGLLFVDLDSFKAVNDNYGHDAGDRVLKVAAERLVACVRAEDTVARMGGDEFVVLLKEIGAEIDLQEMAQKIVLSVAEPVVAGNQVYAVSASVGYVIFPDHASSVEELLRKADNAMYAAKRAGKNCWAGYHDYTKIA